METIDKASFKYCVSQKSVKLHDSVKTLGNNAFQYCIKICSFNMGLVEKIGAHALAGYAALKYLHMPNTLTSVREYAFDKSGIVNLGNFRRLKKYRQKSSKSYSEKKCLILKFTATLPPGLYLKGLRGGSSGSIC